MITLKDFLNNVFDNEETKPYTILKYLHEFIRNTDIWANDAKVEFRFSGGYIQWKYVGDAEWTNLLDMSAYDNKTGVTLTISGWTPILFNFVTLLTHEVYHKFRFQQILPEGSSLAIDYMYLGYEANKYAYKMSTMNDISIVVSDVYEAYTILYYDMDEETWTFYSGSMMYPDVYFGGYAQGIWHGVKV